MWYARYLIICKNPCDSAALWALWIRSWCEGMFIWRSCLPQQPTSSLILRDPLPLFQKQDLSCTAWFLYSSDLLPWILRRLHISVGVRFKYEFSDRGVNFLRYDLHMWKYGYLFSYKISYSCWWLGREIHPSPVPSTCSCTWFGLRNESLSEGDIPRAIDCYKNK